MLGKPSAWGPEKGEHITLNINPEVLDDVSTMNDPHTKVVLNNALTDTQVMVDNRETKNLVNGIIHEIQDFTAEYDNVEYMVKNQMDHLSDALVKYRALKNNEKVSFPDGKIDFSFITDPYH